MTQTDKAILFRQLHINQKLLILPNAWDAMSARLVQATGFPAVATASVATALSNGYADGEKIPFGALLKLVNAVAGALSVPLTVDAEHGFANNTDALQTNIRLLIENGAVGINIEDGKPGGQQLESMSDQCRRIEAIREAAEKTAVPLVINARMDLFMQRPGNDGNMHEAVERIKAYAGAGADCVYPIMVNNYDDIRSIVAEAGTPINVNLMKATGNLTTLEEIGVSRVSLGPGYLYHVLGKMHTVAKELQQYNTATYFDNPPLPRDILNNLLHKPDYITLIHKAYESFNARDIDGVLALMHKDVHWPNGWEGGYVKGHQEVRDYWTRQWKEIDPSVEPVSVRNTGDEKIEVEVHQVARDMQGQVLFDGFIKHIYAVRDGLIQGMEIEK